MKLIVQTGFIQALILCVVILFTGTRLSAQEATSSRPAVIQQNRDNQVMEQDQEMIRQDQKTGELQQDQKQTRDVKKVKDSSPDLTRKRGARPPSISRPSGNTMPKGAGKPAGVNRPGRR